MGHKREGEGRFQAEKIVNKNAQREKVGVQDVKGGLRKQGWLPKGQVITLPSSFILPFKE